MTTNYALGDTLAKDLSGGRLLMPVNDESSVLDFALLRGIGAESLGTASRNLAFLAVGSHKTGSALGTGVGIVAMGAYTESPSAIGTGNAQQLRSDKEGALYVRPASGILSFSAASVETHLTGSLLLHDIHVALVDVNAGDSVRIDDDTGYRFSFIATAASQHFSEHYATGLQFNTSLKHTLTMSGAGTASVTISYAQY